MKLYEIFDGDRYLFSVMPSEDPYQVLAAERNIRRNYRLRLIMVEGGIRSIVEGPGTPEPEDEDDFSAYAEDEDEDE